MATWHVSDELDARLREHLHGGDPGDYVEQLIANQLTYEQELAAAKRIKQGFDEIDRGEGINARDSMRQIADEFGINLDS